jgi:hypothetical protein
MSLFKFGTLGVYSNVINNPRAIVIADTKLGQTYKIVDNYSATIQEGAVAFATDAEVKAGNVWVCLNVIDTPELWRLADFVVKAGTPARSYKLDDLIGYPVELSSDLVSTAYASVAVGDYLIPCNATDDASNPTSWKKAATPTGYAVAIKVMEKTTFGGTGFYGKLTKI